MPVRAARLPMGGRPPLGMGSTNSQSESGSRERAIMGPHNAAFPFFKPGFEMTSYELGIGI